MIAWWLAFVLCGLLGAGLGNLWQQQASLGLWCNGESAHQMDSAERPAWLLTHYSLDLSASGLSHMRLDARLVAADSAAELGVMHRYSAFRAARQGHRLLVEVAQHVRSDTDTLPPELLSSLGFFLFQPRGNLSYWLQTLDETRYLIDDGAGVFLLCNRRPQVAATDPP